MSQNVFQPPRHRRPIQSGFSWNTAGALACFAGFLGVIAYFSPQVAAVLYCPLYMALAWVNPAAALFIMFAEVCFPFDVGGATNIAHTAPAEISLVLAGLIFWLRSLGRSSPRRISNPIFFPILFYFGICFASTFTNWTGRDAVVSFLQMALYLVFCVKVFSSWVPERRQMYAAFYGLMAGCTFISLFLLITRSNDVLGIHKNATGTFLSYLVIILVEMAVSKSIMARRPKLLSLILAFNLAGLVMSTSRGAWMGTLVGLSLLLACRRQFKLFGKVLLVMIPAIAVCWLLVPQNQREYALNVSTNNRDVSARYATIDFYASRFHQSPIIGMGMGLRKEADSTNIVMSTLAETGAMGLAAFLLIHLVFLVTTFNAMRKTPRSHPDFTFLVLGSALILCLFTHGLVDHYWSRTQIPVWAMVGAAIAVRKNPGGTFAPAAIRHPLGSAV